MTSRERVLSALHLSKPDMVPFFDSIDEKIKQSVIGKKNYNLMEFVNTFSMDAVEYEEGFSPPLLVRASMRNEIDYIEEGLLRTESDLAKIQFPDPCDEAFYDDAKRFIDKYKDSGYALYTKTRLGASALLNSMGLENFAYALADDTGFVEKALDTYVHWCSRVIEKLSKIGFDFIMCADDIAYSGGLMFSPQVFRELFLPRMKIAADACGIPWIYHSDGDIMSVMDDLLMLGMNGIHPMEPGPMDIKAVKEKYGTKVCLLGNIDLGYTLTRGTVEEVEAEVAERIRDIGKDGGYIICSSNSIPAYCKVENVIAMIEAIKKYRIY